MRQFASGIIVIFLGLHFTGECCELGPMTQELRDLPCISDSVTNCVIIGKSLSSFWSHVLKL